MTWVLAIVAILFALWRIGRRLRFCLHVAQLEGYKTGPFAAWMMARPRDVLFRTSHLLGLLVLAGLVMAPADGSWPVVAGFAAWAITFASSRRYRRDRPKKPLAPTPRLKRLAVASTLPAAVSVAVGTVMAFAGDAPFTSLDAARLLGGFYVADLMAPLWTVFGLLATRPVERAIHESFKKQARETLATRPDLIIVAVTGSYGKTSVKFAIAEMLAQRYNVLATPGSFNTPMGICRVVNDQLRPDHQVLVLEMGIRHPGDVAELCEIARPHVAVITAIGVAHLESMGSVEAIAREKGSLLDYLLPGGSAVLNADDAYFAVHRARWSGPVVSVSATGDPSADFRASDVAFSRDGTSYTVTGREGRSETVRTPLLGRHHVTNTLLGLAVAHVLGVRLRSAALAAGRLKPVAHRLALRREQGLWILDDAFNSNPVGAAAAVEVLGHFSGRRFVITPGMVELGDRETEENERFGRALAAHADEVWLVGPERTRPIARGLESEGFPVEHIHVVKTLFEARDEVRRIAGPDDVVLYENDLPDQYTEA